jgi:LemA protein
LSHKTKIVLLGNLCYNLIYYNNQFINMEQNFFQRNKTMIVVLAIIALVAIWLFGSYNGFVSANENVNNSWAQVENQLQRRFDLIPNLVSTVKGITGQEQKVFGDLAEARTRYSGAGSVNEKAQYATQVESALGRLLVIAENYPQLQSSQAFRDLMVQLEGTENRISVERMRYNDTVKNFNLKVKTLPSNIVAKIFGFDEKAYFEIKEEAKNVPKVEFSS